MGIQNPEKTYTRRGQRSTNSVDYTDIQLYMLTKTQKVLSRSDRLENLVSGCRLKHGAEDVYKAEVWIKGQDLKSSSR